jgi:Holliday junction resolvase RusA-like endonuclease
MGSRELRELSAYQGCAGAPSRHCQGRAEGQAPRQGESVIEPIVIEVPGKPVPASRGRAFVQGGRIIVTTPPGYRRWKNDAGVLARQAMAGREPLTCPVELSVQAYVPIAPGWPAWRKDAARHNDIEPCGSPDLDNIIKAAMDALNQVVWVDDSQVVELEAGKQYSQEPGVFITVTPRLAASSRITRKDQLSEGAP